MQRRLTQLEDAIRTTSTLRTQGLVQILSVYGLPFFISGGIVNALSSWLDEWMGKPGAAQLKVAIYLGLAASLIIGVRRLQGFLSRTKMPPKALASRPESEL